MVVCEEICCQILPQGIWHISGECRLDCLLGLMLGTGLAMINIIGDVGIYPGPVDSGLGEVSIFSIPLWLPCRLLSILSYSSGGIHTLSPFSSIPFSTVNSSWMPQK